MSRGFGREPFQLRVLANGRVLDTRRVDARGRRLADRRGLHRLARSGEGDRLHRRDRRRPPASRSSRTTSAACWSARPAGSGGCWRSRARPDSSTASWRARWPHDPGSISTPSSARARTTAARTPSSSRLAAAASAKLTAGFPATPRSAVRLRRAHHRERRERLLHARAAADGRRLRVGARRRPAGPRRPLVCAARSDRHAARRGAAGRAERSPRRTGARVATIADARRASSDS